MTWIVSKLTNREQLPCLIKHRLDKGVIVEIGTHQGLYSLQLLKQSRGTVCCVDPWDNTSEEYIEQARMLPTPSVDRRDDHKLTVERLQVFGGRARILKMTSLQALGHFRDESVDLVYVDGDHSYESVLSDLTQWWRKIRSGGYLAGHDIVCPGEQKGGWGQTIQPAVRHFVTAARPQELDVYLIVDCNFPWSFYIQKP